MCRFSTEEKTQTVLDKLVTALKHFITRAARDTETTAVPNKLHGFLINLHQPDGVHVGQNATVKSTGSHLAEHTQLKYPTPIQLKFYAERDNIVNANLAIHVGNAAVALSCSIKLPDLPHPKSLCEGFPHTGAKSIPHCQANSVALLGWPDRL